MAANPSRATRARDLALRLAGVAHSRRLYSTGGPARERALVGLCTELEGFFEEMDLSELTLGLVGDGVALGGIPIQDPPASVLRLRDALGRRDLEIVSIQRGCPGSELEVFFSFLALDEAQLLGLTAEQFFLERGVSHIRFRHLKLTHGTGIHSFREVFRRGGERLRKEYDRAHKRGVVDPGALRELAFGLMEMVVHGNAPVATLLALRDRDDFAMVHSINVALLVGAQASTLGLEESVVEELSMAAPLHDLGKARVPEGLLSARSRLTPKELQLLAEHTAAGAQVLVDSPGLGPTAAIVAFSHHGPPTEILAVELCRIADTFDVLRTLRPFSDEAGRRAAGGAMLTLFGRQLNRYLLERFLVILGLYRDGDVGRVSSGELVRVLKPNPELACRPTVEVLEAENGRFSVGEIVELFRLNGEVVMVPEVSAEHRSIEAWEIAQLG